MAVFPAAGELSAGLDSTTSEKWTRLLAVRDAVLKALEAARQSKQIAGSLEARVLLGANSDLSGLLERYSSWLPALFIVSQVELEGGDGAGELIVRVERAHGSKCERCWNYSERVGESPEWPTLCERCVATIAEIAETSAAEPAGAGPAS